MKHLGTDAYHQNRGRIEAEKDRELVFLEDICEENLNQMKKISGKRADPRAAFINHWDK